MSLLTAIASLVFVLSLTAGCGRDRGENTSAQVDDPVSSIPGAPVQVSDPSDGCGGGGMQAGASVGSIEADGLTRSYRLYVPIDYDQALPEPLVLNFHGFGSNGASQEAYSGFVELAEREGFVVVSPDGAGSPAQWHTFGRLQPRSVNDVSFVEQLLDHLTATVCIDEARIYAAGLSNSGGMAQVLACRVERIAAIGVVAGAPFVDAGCDDPGLMPVIAFHGTADQVVAFEGEGSILGLTFTPVRTTMSEWAERNGCDGVAVETRVAADVVWERYEGCDEGSAVELYVIEGGGHTWPGAIDRPGLGRITQSISASQLMWEFCEAHPGR